MGRVCSIHGKVEKYIQNFDWITRRRPLGRPRHGCEGNIEWILEKYGEKFWTEFIWLRIGIIGRLM
jgi:hypothetical protein